LHSRFERGYAQQRQCGNSEKINLSDSENKFGKSIFFFTFAIQFIENGNGTINKFFKY
jgi:hypothetical protein